ncbi:hypothetical protein [Demequina mangrovi]|uniref:Uncharacterized protein n=1 Tax=Demequina mangrovi TaxID=1043493 RepID=A0A1H6U9M6_9MICO|nr:hypothetical protein [Demequina mangrovi]SEI84960.1 hypothetical protein SAMN05421637_0182 [Demequina mangrovi]
MRAFLALTLAATVLAGCTGAVDEPEVAPDVAARLDALDAAVADWAAASSLDEAQIAAEAARNLVVGPAGPLYGDADGDGMIAGEVDAGLLPGLDGSPGVTAEPAVNACVERDVLGGSWEQPEERWDEALTAIDAWAPGNNTFPSLASHPQRVVGWATLTLETDDLDEAHEYSSHAQLHVDVARTAFESCDA